MTGREDYECGTPYCDTQYQHSNHMQKWLVDVQALWPYVPRDYFRFTPSMRQVPRPTTTGFRPSHCTIPALQNVPGTSTYMWSNSYSHEHGWAKVTQFQCGFFLGFPTGGPPSTTSLVTGNKDLSGHLVFAGLLLMFSRLFQYFRSLYDDIGGVPVECRPRLGLWHTHRTHSPRPEEVSLLMMAKSALGVNTLS